MSIVEVAERAGVSKSTVSRVINRVPGVAEDLCAKVKRAMEELDYHPSPRRPGPKPASRRGIKSGNVLLLTSGYEAGQVYRMPIFPDILLGAESALADAGMNLVVAELRDDGSRPAALASDQSDGALLIARSGSLSPSLQRMLAAIPTIVLLRTFEQMPGPFDRVIYNNRAVGPMAAEHLLSRGHRHTGFFNANPNHPAFDQRQRMFTEVVTAAGGRVIDLATDLAMPTPHLQMNTQVKQMLQASPRITGLCVSHDHALPQLYNALRSQGVAPQKDIEIISCDNNAAALDMVDPIPSTIDIRPELMGRLAVRQLQWRLAHPNEGGPMTISVEPCLVAADPPTNVAVEP